MNDQKKYILFESPRHSWMRVAISELKELNILEDISPFSFTDEEFAYLEEDMDMGTFIMSLWNVRRQQASLLIGNVKSNAGM